MKYVLCLAVALATTSIADEPDSGCDVAYGKRVFRTCLACHTARPGAGHLSGPNLVGLMGRRFGGADGYEYSEPFMASEEVWNDINLFSYLSDPQGYLPGSRMMYAGISEREDSDAIACYLRSLDEAS